MAQHEIKHTGFIRTVSFLKSIDMFRADKITKLHLERGIQTSKVHEEYPQKTRQKPYFFRDQLTIDNYKWEWDAKLHPGLCPVDRVKKVIDKTACGDYVLKEIVVELESPALVEHFNGMLELKAKNKKIVKLREGCRFYATFKSNPNDELRRLEFLKELNRKEIDEYKFKPSSLDLTALCTERAKKYGEREFLNVNNDLDVIRSVLKALDWDGWPEETRVVDKGGLKSYPKPAAIRSYKYGGTNGWMLTGQEEI